jgi:hypothetical protein
MGLLVIVAAAALQFPAWPALFKVLRAYGYAARIPVAIVMFFAIRQSLRRPASRFSREELLAKVPADCPGAPANLLDRIHGDHRYTLFKYCHGYLRPSQACDSLVTQLI